MKKLFIFLFIIFIIPNVFAQDFTVNTSDITSPNSSGTGKYSGTEIYNTGTNNVYNIGTRYSGQLSRIIFNLTAGGYADPDGFEKGHIYTLSLNMATDDWRNRFGSVSVKCEGSSGQELSNGRVSYISYRKIKFSFTAPTDRYCQFVYVDLKSTNITSTAFTGISNWNLSSMVISDPYYCDNCGSSTNPTPTPTNPVTPTPDYSSIINNQKENTDSIINNQNDNTTNIIENNNNNTDSINSNIDKNLNECEDSYNLMNPTNAISVTRNSITFTPFFSDDSFLRFVRVTGTSNSSSATFYIIAPNLNLYVNNPMKVSGSRNNTQVYCESTTGTRYTSDIPTGITIKECALRLGGGVTENNYIYPMLRYADKPNLYVPYGQPICDNRINILNKSILSMNSSFVNKIQDQIYAEQQNTTNIINNQNANQAQTNQKLDDINNTMNNDNIDDKTSFFTNFDNDSHGLTGIITLPLTTIQSLSNSSCVQLSLPIPFTNSNVSLPCMTQVYQTYIPSVFNIWQVVSFGIISYLICIDIFKMVKGFKDPNEDKVEVLDL